MIAARIANFVPRRSYSVNTAKNSDLKGKRVLITGSTAGIGLGYANAFAEHGCSVVLNGFGDAKVN
jgi:NADP-dependent 3-hydroxy acid dehydrogenase YdfG